MTFPKPCLLIFISEFMSLAGSKFITMPWRMTSCRGLRTRESTKKREEVRLTWGWPLNQITQSCPTVSTNAGCSIHRQSAHLSDARGCCDSCLCCCHMCSKGWHKDLPLWKLVETGLPPPPSLLPSVESHCVLISSCFWQTIVGLRSFRTFLYFLLSWEILHPCLNLWQPSSMIFVTCCFPGRQSRS